MGCGAPRDLAHLRQVTTNLPGVISDEASPDAWSDGYFGTRVLAVGVALMARRDTSALQSRIAAIWSSAGDRWMDAPGDDVAVLAQPPREFAGARSGWHPPDAQLCTLQGLLDGFACLTHDRDLPRVRVESQHGRGRR